MSHIALRLVATPLLACCLLAATSSASARDIAGVSIPETVQLAPQGTTLQLNGAGIRSKFIFDIYVGALYVSTPPVHTLQALLALPGPKRVSMFLLYHKVSAEKMRAAWQDGFAANLDAAQRQALAPALARFESLFPTMREGDVADVDFLPGKGVRVTLNGTLRGSVDEPALIPAVLKVWLGREPADEDLKAGMLGTD